MTTEQTQNQESTGEVKSLDLEIAPIESITRAEVDVQIATAHQYPRSLAQFYKRAEAMVTVDEETAKSCFYQLRRKDRTEPSGYKTIEGESIRMAEIVAANFGNLRSAVHVVGHTPTRVTVRAVCHDLETNNLIAVEKQTKTTYSDGSPYNEDMAITSTNALISKALRDAIFRVVPKALIKPLKEKAKLVAFGTGQAFIDRRKRAVEWATKTRGVPLERVLATLDVKGEADITIDHLTLLTGLKNAIMEGDQTVDEAFPPLESETKPILEHPEQKKQREAAEAAAAEATRKEVKEAVEKASKAAKEKKVAAVTEKKPEPAPAPAAADEKAEAAMGLAPQQPKPENVVPLPVKEEPKPEPAPEPKPEVKAEPAPAPAPTPAPEPAPNPGSGELKAGQAQLKAAIEGVGYTFPDLINTLAGKIAGFPKKTDPACPKDWNQIEEAKAAYCYKSIKGLLAAIKNSKEKGGK